MLAVCLWLTKYTAVYRYALLDQTPEVLRARAKDIIKQLGYADQAMDTVDGFVLREDLLRYIAANDQSPSRWNKLGSGGPGPYRYWYRQSPRYFETFEPINEISPALDVSGMTSLYLDMQGQLRWFIGVPPQREPPETKFPAPDWSVAFRQAGMDLANFQPVTSQFVPLHAYDTRAAWEGVDPNRPDLKTHVEAAAFHGRLVYFETIYPWDKPWRQEVAPESGGTRALTIMVIAVYLFVLIGSIFIARRNLQQGRGDRRGAARVAIFYFIVRMSVWLFGEHHNGSLGYEFDLFLLAMSRAVFTSGFLWVLYAALEPFIRRRWPRRIVSWSRLLAGSFRDPLVGRDVLIGGASGVLMILITMIGFVALRWIGQPPELISNPGSQEIGVHLFVKKFTSEISSGLYLAFFAFFMLLVFVIVLRRERLALIALTLLVTVLSALIAQSNVRMIPLVLLYSAIFVFVLYRYGFLALVCGLFISHLWVFFAMTTDLTAWYATDFVIALLICVAITIYGFYTSLAGQSLLAGRLLED
jgi:eukaryotic-like serine/threonine-protein kinase